jgi:hypothetical protein
LIWAGAGTSTGTCGLAVYREFGSLADPSVGVLPWRRAPGNLRACGQPVGRSVQIWLQVRDVHAEHERLTTAGVRVLREPTAEPWD